MAEPICFNCSIFSRGLSELFFFRITPILDPQQQQKFKTMREDMRRDMIEKMGSQAMEKAEAKVKQEM